MMRNSSPLLFAAYYYTSIILSSCCCYAFNAWIVINGQWCGTQTKSTEWHRHRTHYHRQAIIVNVAAFDDTCIHEKNHFKTSTSYYNTILSADYGHVRRAGLFSRAASWIRRTKPSSSSSSCDDSILEVEKQQSAPIYRFTYDYNEMIIDSAAAIGQRTNSQQSITTTTGIMLIHPIGVGIVRSVVFLVVERTTSHHQQYAHEGRSTTCCDLGARFTRECYCMLSYRHCIQYCINEEAATSKHYRLVGSDFALNVGV